MKILEPYMCVFDKHTNRCQIPIRETSFPYSETNRHLGNINYENNSKSPLNTSSELPTFLLRATDFPEAGSRGSVSDGDLKRKRIQ